MSNEYHSLLIKLGKMYFLKIRNNILCHAVEKNQQEQQSNNKPNNNNLITLLV